MWLPAQVNRRPASVSGSLLVAGTTSDAGKSVLTAAICRWLHRQGISVAPFKAQNMSNNSAVTADGAEIGRAQVAQAAACGIEPEAAMNPVLLKPGSDRRSHVVLMGRPYGEASAMGYRDLRDALRQKAFEAYDDLRSRFDVVVCEGAGSPAEINLRDGDFVNMGLARARRIPTIVVGDIDRGGIFAAMYGTLALLAAADQDLLSGFVVNKFRGDPALLQPGLDMFTTLTGRPMLGVLPWATGLALDLEDSLSLDNLAAPGARAPDEDRLRVVVVRLPRISNSTDVEALGLEPGVDLRWTTSPRDLDGADLVVLPGSRATVDDLDWLRRNGIASAVIRRAAAGGAVLGICGGYQMLARTITDTVESGAGAVAGLGLLPVDVVFGAEKITGRRTGTAYGEKVTTAYEIHHGIASVDAGAEAFLDGCRSGAVQGTTWHGAWESDGFRRAFLADVADRAGRELPAAEPISFAASRAAQLDALADLVAEHLDTAALLDLIEHGAPADLPFIPPGAPGAA